MSESTYTNAPAEPARLLTPAELHELQMKLNVGIWRAAWELGLLEDPRVREKARRMVPPPRTP